MSAAVPGSIPLDYQPPQTEGTIFPADEATALGRVLPGTQHGSCAQPGEQGEGQPPVQTLWFGIEEEEMAQRKPGWWCSPKKYKAAGQAKTAEAHDAGQRLAGT